MRRILQSGFLCLLFAGAGCGATADAPPKANMSPEERAKKAKEMTDGIEKQNRDAQEAAESRRPGG
jgi:hypothetical protein